MTAEQLQLEILEAQRIIERNKIILQQSNLIHAAKKEIEAKNARIAELEKPAEG